jgi:hypothetical protein
MNDRRLDLLELARVHDLLQGLAQQAPPAARHGAKRSLKAGLDGRRAPTEKAAAGRGEG